MGSWAARDAKNQFGELLDEAQAKGPQVITRNGRERAVVLSMEEYRALAGKKMDFKEYLLSGPRFDDMKIPRDRSKVRAVRL